MAFSCVCHYNRNKSGYFQMVGDCMSHVLVYNGNDLFSSIACYAVMSNLHSMIAAIRALVVEVNLIHFQPVPEISEVMSTSN